MTEFLQELNQLFSVTMLSNLLAAILILIVGWLVALVVSRLVRTLLRNTTLDDRIANMLTDDPQAPAEIPVERWISIAVFWLIMLFALVAFLNQLNLAVVSRPLNELLTNIVTFLPNLLVAAVLLFVAWLLATFLRMLVVRLLNVSGLTRRLSEGAEVEEGATQTASQTIGNVVYWLVFLLFLPAILDALNLQGLLAPVQSMVNDILSFLPNLLAAAVILFAGWLVARIIRSIVVNLLEGLGIDRLGVETGVSGALGQTSLARVIGTIVYILILIPVAIAALNALNIPAISQPAAQMLTNLLEAIPAIFGAFLLLAIAYFVARLVGNFVASILATLGFNRLFQWLGLTPATTIDVPAPRPGPEAPRTPDMGTEPVEPVEPAMRTVRMTPSEIAGYLVTVAIMLFAAMEAANLLGFEFLATLIADFIVVAANVLAGLIIFALGLYLASIAERVIRSAGGSQANILAPAARIAIIVFSAALALREMGIAESIVNLAFGLLLGAIAVAAALAFGLGGRDIAARMLERWRAEMDARTGPDIGD